MQKIRVISALIIFIVIINLIIPIYADDEIEESGITPEEMDKILEAATDASDIPTINARNAVIYDRIAR